MDDIFGGPLEQFGIRENVNPESTTPTSRCLSDGANYLWVNADEEGNVIQMARYGPFNMVGAILAAIYETFGVDIFSEYEPQYWGFSTQQEWAEWRNAK